MILRVFIPRDAGALVVGADEVAGALRQAAFSRSIDLEIVRTGSRGLYWLEPLVEVGYATHRERILKPMIREKITDPWREVSWASTRIPACASQTCWTAVRRGMATGMAIMGFGGGAMIGTPLADLLMNYFRTPTSVGVWETFLTMGTIYFVFMLIGAFGYRLPATGWLPDGWTPLNNASTMITRHHVQRKRGGRSDIYSFSSGRPPIPTGSAALAWFWTPKASC